MLSKLLKIVLILDLIIVNGVVGYLAYLKFGPAPTNFAESSFENMTYPDKCGQECRSVINTAISQLTASLAGQLAQTIADDVEPTTPVKPTIKPTAAGTAKKVRREEILTIPGSGSGVTTDWTGITTTEFYFDTRDYPGIVEVYFEANMKLLNGNGVAYVRLFDVTHGIGVAGSDNDTTSQADVWVKSQKVYFWAGRNLVRVQVKSLTADTAVYNQGRLRIVTEN